MRTKAISTRAKKTPSLATNKSVKHMFKPIKKQSELKPSKSTSILAASTPIHSQTSPGISSPNKNTKRNLFGIRLNHDQLNRDLKEMWKDQIERQKQQWNFDFEKLKPVNLNRSAKSLNDLSLNDSNRYDWIRVNTYYGPQINGYSPSIQSISLPNHLLDTSLENTDFVVSAFDKSEIDYEHKLYKSESQIDDVHLETETEEEEEDEALAVPQFYKYQRRLKLIKEKKENKEVKESKKVAKLPSKVTKPRRILTRRTRRNSTGSNEGKKLTQSLIITFSENRKETLRSAHVNSNVNNMEVAKSDKKENLKQSKLIVLIHPKTP